MILDNVLAICEQCTVHSTEEYTHNYGREFSVRIGKNRYIYDNHGIR